MDIYNDAVYEIEEWLRELFYAGYPIDEIIPDGIYDAKTRKAVSDYQRYANLPVTGVVDRETWDSLLEAYTKAVFKRSRPYPLYPFPETEGYTLTPGEVSDIVLIVQILLNTLAAYHDGITVTPNGIYDAQTRRSVEEFQRTAGIDVTGLVDKATWNHLTEVYHRHNRIDT